MNRTAFMREGLSIVPRALGLCDRDPESPTYGCADRSYWHYRVLDFPNARCQETGWLLALAYVVDTSENMFYGREPVKSWSKAVWRYWLAQRNRDGSVSEVYPREQSFCATAFGAAAFVETVRLLGGAADWKQELSDAERTFEWLAGRQNPEVSNQNAASLLALSGAGVLTGDTRLTDAANKRRDALLEAFADEGAFPEYGGYDTGYQSITMACLARVLDWTGTDADILDCLKKGEMFLAGRIDPHGTVDASLNSRSTQFIYPSALSFLRSALEKRLLTGLSAGRSLRPSWMDDRYCVPFAVDCVLAGLKETDVDVTS